MKFLTSLSILSLLFIRSLAKEGNLRFKEDKDIKFFLDDGVLSEDRDRFLKNFFVSDAESNDPTKHRSKRFVVKYKSHEAMTRSKSKRAQQRNMSATTLLTMDSLDVEVMKIKTRAQYEELEADDDVLYIEKDQRRYLLDTIPVKKRNLQNSESDEVVPYGIDMVKALDVSDEFVANQKLCIIDTGYDVTHPDLPNDPNVVSGNNNKGNKWNQDGNGHGTHVAGTIAAIGGNNEGVVGVNRNGKLKLHIEKIFSDNGRPIFGSTLIGAVGKCIEAGSTIISMSLGGPIGMEIEREFFDRVLKVNNVLVIAAAGNGGNKRYSYPASYSSVMSVAAIDSDKKLAFFSQRNDEVDIAAPGVGVLSTKTGGGFIEYSGTSMACPHASGVAALVWSHYPTRSAIEIRGALEMSAEDLGSVGRDDSYGHGLILADAAFELLSNDNFSLMPTASPTPERECFDFENYADGRGNGCNWYERGLFTNRCALFGSSRANGDNIVADDACCVCGGGAYEGIGNTSPTVSPSPTASPTNGPTACVDDDGWFNSRGKGCDWYGPFRCLLFGGSLASDDGVVANEACCLCQSLL